MRTSIISLFLLLLYSTLLYSQSPNFSINTSNTNLNPEIVKNYVDNLKNNVLNYSSQSEKSEDIIGSPYIDETFRKVTADGIDLTLQVRYNVYTDKMEFQKDKEIYDLIVPQNIILNFPETKQSIQKLQYNLNGNITDGYLYVLYRGKKLSLYKKEKILLKYDEGANNSYVDHSKVRFNNKKPEYIIFSDNQYQILPKSKKEFITLFGEKTADFFKRSKNKLSNDEDYIKIAEFLDSIK